MGSFVNLSRPTLETATVENPCKVRLPSGYILFAHPMLPGDSYPSKADHWLNVSIYPPGSDCVSRDDCVGELEIPREGADVLLRMCAPPFPGKDGDGA